eukprot:SAG31_NODE_7185_length_1762_cov_2.084185_3_plen_102_part_01
MMGWSGRGAPGPAQTPPEPAQPPPEDPPPEPAQPPPSFASDWDVGDVGDVLFGTMGVFPASASTDGSDAEAPPERKSDGFFSSSSSSEGPFSESDEVIDEVG